MPPAMKRLLADLQLPANRFDRRALVEVHLRLAQLRNDLLRRVSLPFHRVLPPSRAVRLSYQLVHLEGVRSREAKATEIFSLASRALRETPPSPGPYLTAEQERRLNELDKATDLLHLEIESFYLFAKILLDAAARAIEK